MRISKAKLIKGMYLEVSFHDGNAEVHKSYSKTEASPKLTKAFQKFNHHLADLCEQHTNDGNTDYDNIAALGYSIKGEGEKEGVTVTGIRTLATGRSITLNSPFIGLEISESDYANCKKLVSDLDNCRTEILVFMENNKSSDEIQGNLFKSETVILSPEKTAQQRTEDALNGNETDVTDLYIPKEGKGKKGHTKPSAKEMQEAVKERLDEELMNEDYDEETTESIRQEAMRLNAIKNKGKKK